MKSNSISSHVSEQTKQLKLSNEIIALIDIYNVDTDKLMKNIIAVQAQYCQWTQLENGQNIKMIQFDLGQSAVHMVHNPQPQVCVFRSVSCSAECPTGNEESTPSSRSELIDFGYSASVLSKYGILSNPRSLVVSIDSNMRDEESCSFLVAANFGRSAISNGIPDDVTRMIEHYCSRLFPKDLSIDVMNDLEAEDTYFDELVLWVCDNGFNDIQIAMTLYDDNIASLLCYLRADGIKMQTIENDDKFDDSMAQTGYKKITLRAMKIDSIDLPFAQFRAFIEKERNFAGIDTVDIVHNLLFNYLNIKRWKTSDGLKWFLKALLKN